MTEQLPVLIVMIPFLAALVVPIVGTFKKSLAQPLTVLALLASLYASAKALCEVVTNGTMRYALGNWAAPIGIEYVIDTLNGVVLVVVALVAFLTAIYSKNLIEKELPGKVTPFYTLFLLSVTGLAGMTITGDAFNMYVLLEISSLSSYSLLALGQGRGYLATFNYLIMGTIGASFYLIGVGYLLIKTGSLNMTDISQILTTLHGSQAVFVAFLFIMVGVWIKAAFFPLHSWLPNVYTYAPSVVACLIAPLMTKVSVYIMIRMMYGVFSPDYVFGVLNWQPIVVGLSVVAIVAGSMFALAQTNLKKMVTFIIVAEVAYMVGGTWLANANGLSGAIYHIIADAMMTLCLFMAIGNIMHKTGAETLEDMKGIFRKMPLTMAGFIVGAISMIGIPPTAGFFSKWYLILGAIDANSWAFMAALLFSSLVNAVLFFRIIEIGYFRLDGDAAKAVVRDEAPLSMVVPLLLVAGSLIAIGLLTNDIMTTIIAPAIPANWI